MVHFLYDRGVIAIHQIQTFHGPPQTALSALPGRIDLCRLGNHARSLPVCGLRYGREEGYFSGGMDLSFFLAAPVLAFIFLVVYQVFSATLSLIATLFLSYAVFLPWAIPLFRYSRALWLYIDWQLDPVHEVKPAPPPPITTRAWSMPTPKKPWTHDSLFALAQHLAM